MPHGRDFISRIDKAEKAFCLTSSHVFSDSFHIEGCGLANLIGPGGRCLTWNLQLLDYIHGFIEMLLLTEINGTEVPCDVVARYFGCPFSQYLRCAKRNASMAHARAGQVDGEYKNKEEFWAQSR